jgi:hypothetical protein
MDQLDVYDPTFEEDLNSLPDDDMIAEEEDFGFISEDK